MNTRTHLNNATDIASRVNWADPRFSWQKAYVASVFAALAYEEIPEFELKNLGVPKSSHPTAIKPISQGGSHGKCAQQ